MPVDEGRKHDTNPIIQPNLEFTISLHYLAYDKDNRFCLSYIKISFLSIPEYVDTYVSYNILILVLL